MTEDTEDLEGNLGFDKKTAAEMLLRFVKTKEDIRRHIEDLKATRRTDLGPSQGSDLDRAISDLEQSKDKVESQIITVREWYGLHVLEGLEKGSRRLEWLTIALIGLTAVLAFLTALLWLGIR